LSVLSFEGFPSAPYLRIPLGLVPLLVSLTKIAGWGVLLSITIMEIFTSIFLLDENTIRPPELTGDLINIYGFFELTPYPTKTYGQNNVQPPVSQSEALWVKCFSVFKKNLTSRNHGSEIFLKIF
jgi:hypothetical protein